MKMRGDVWLSFCLASRSFCRTQVTHVLPNLWQQDWKTAVGNKEGGGWRKCLLKCICIAFLVFVLGLCLCWQTGEGRTERPWNSASQNRHNNLKSRVESAVCAASHHRMHNHNTCVVHTLVRTSRSSHHHQPLHNTDEGRLRGSCFWRLLLCLFHLVSRDPRSGQKGPLLPAQTQQVYMSKTSKTS